MAPRRHLISSEYPKINPSNNKENIKQMRANYLAAEEKLEQKRGRRSGESNQETVKRLTHMYEEEYKRNGKNIEKLKFNTVLEYSALTLFIMKKRVMEQF